MSIPTREHALVLDASSYLIKAGILYNHQWLAFAQTQTQALEGIFELVQQVHESAGINIKDIKHTIIGCGPGSILGIRLSCIAARCWQALDNTRESYTYNRLLFAERANANQINATDSAYAILTESRMKRWNVLVRHSVQTTPEIKEYTTEQLIELPPQRYYLPQKEKSTIPFEAISIKDGFYEHPTLFYDERLILHSAEPDAYLVTSSDYQKWSGMRHSKHNATKSP